MPPIAPTASPVRRKGRVKSNRVISDLAFFSSESISSETALELAVAELHQQNWDSSTFVDVIAETTERPLLLSLFISTAREDVFSSFGRWVLDSFPATAADFDDSLCSNVLENISKSLVLITYQSPFAVYEHLLARRRFLERARPVLQALTSYINSDEMPGTHDELLEGFAVKRARTSQKQSKRAKRAARSSTLGPALFAAIDKEVPGDQQEVRALAAAVLKDLKESMMYCLNLLRDPNIVDLVNAAYLPRTSPAQEDDDTEVAESTLPLTDEPVAGPPSAYPSIQPMRASLYFESAEGFGEWRLHISSSAEKDLRSTWKKDPKTFDIVVKKLKELSNGQFSSDNQKKLSGPGTEVPIFEAKMTGDLRLIYQVDCLQEFSSESAEQQVLKIYGVYTHAQIDKRFWASVSQQITSKGPEYRRRCNFRRAPALKGDYVVMPETFPQVPDDGGTDPSSSVMPIRKEDLAGMHNLLVLDKYIAFSQALLNSILADQEVAHVFNLFPPERQIIDHRGSSFVVGRSGTGKTNTMVFKILGLERTWQLLAAPDTPKPRQVFVTASGILADKVKEYFTKLLGSHAIATRSPEELVVLAARKEKANRLMINVQDQRKRRDDLPERFSGLEDTHFPLFLTYATLCQMIEGDMFPNGSLSENLISYANFLADYWSHFPQSLVKGIVPSLVYSEFLGVIKGSEGALQSEIGYLDRDTYLNLSHRTNPTFLSKRSTVYDLFEAYTRRKKLLGGIDPADRTRAILQHIKSNGLEGQKIDFLYVDEAQDNVLIEHLLLRLICHNVDGMLWAGDTAQTISVGSSFRFEDLKAFLFRAESQIRQDTRSIRRYAPPRDFQLTMNYRSHDGIVRCARSLVELVSHFWPYSIDVLAAERGVIDGEKPTFFAGWEPGTQGFEKFMADDSGEKIEFGAHQCILVRNDSAKRSLKREMGNTGIILNLYESKGLEFDDVLIYNFFEDSAIDASRWRVILGADNNGLRGDMPVPIFDETRHAGVCSELKFLYVAVTRARRNLWIVDCSNRAEPIRILWTSKGLVDIHSSGTDLPRLAVASSKSDWAETGQNLFEKGIYGEAVLCFEKASRPREQAIAQAHLLLQEAQVMPAGTRRNDLSRATAHVRAAESFLKCAGDAFEDSDQAQVFFETAAECFSRANKHRRAAEAYRSAYKYTLSAQHYRKAGLFDDVVDIMRDHKEDMDPEVVKSLSEVSRIYFMQHRRLDMVEETTLFSSTAAALDFLDYYDLDATQAALLVKLNCVADAAAIHEREGRVVVAVELLLQKDGDISLLRLAKDFLLRHLWKALCLGVSLTRDELDDDTRRLLLLSQELETKLVQDSDHTELIMFRAIADHDLQRLHDLWQSTFFPNHNDAASFLCLDHYFSSPPPAEMASPKQTQTTLHCFHAYVQHLHRLAYAQKTIQDPVAQKVLGLAVIDSSVMVRQGSLLDQHIIEHLGRVPQDTNQDRAVLPQLASQIIHEALAARLQNRVLLHEERWRKAPVFSPPCYNFLTHKCDRVCGRQHLVTRSLDAAWYKTHLGNHFQQVRILQAVLPHLSRYNRQTIQRTWLSKLYDVLYPIYHTLGSLGNLDRHDVHAAGDAISIIKIWIREFVYHLYPFRVSFRYFLSDFLLATSVIFALDGESAHGYLYRAKCMSFWRPDILFRGKFQDYVLPEALQILKGTDRDCITRGILFLCHTLETRIPIDLAIMCNLIDLLVGLLVFAHRSSREPTLHGIVLPNSWISRHSRNLRHVSGMDTSLVLMLIAHMAELIKSLYYVNQTDADADDPSENNHLQYKGHGVSTVPYNVRQMFIARICRALCLLGLNIEVTLMRDRIRRAVTVLGQNGADLSRLHSRYAGSSTWEELAAIVTQSAASSPLDEMVQLHHWMKPRDRDPLRVGVRLVVYKTIGDIAQLLQQRGPQLLWPQNERSSLTHLASTVIPLPTASQQAIVAGQDERGGRRSSHNQTRAEDAHAGPPSQTDSVNNIPISHDLAATVIQKAFRRSLWRREGKAARTIQRAFQRFMRGKKRVKSGLQAKRDLFFSQCRNEVKQGNILEGRYRMLYLGLLPHLLLCLDTIHQYAYSLKRKAKSKVQSVHHEELETLRDSQTATNQLYQRTTELRRKLEPQAATHRRRERTELRDCTIEIHALMDEVSPGAVQDVREDMQLALTVIVGTRSKKLKPTLCVEDEM